jgi:hypothetical protein
MAHYYDYPEIVQINLEHPSKLMMASSQGDVKALFEKTFEKVKTIESKYPFPNLGFPVTDPRNSGPCF